MCSSLTSGENLYVGKHSSWLAVGRWFYLGIKGTFFTIYELDVAQWLKYCRNDVNSLRAVSTLDPPTPKCQFMGPIPCKRWKYPLQIDTCWMLNGRRIIGIDYLPLNVRSSETLSLLKASMSSTLQNRIHFQVALSKKTLVGHDILAFWQLLMSLIQFFVSSAFR